MAENLPINFPLPGPRAIASYDYFDFASGFGYRELFLWGGRNEAVGGGAVTDIYALTHQTIPSDNSLMQLTRNSNGTTTQNFDIEFKSPQMIQGRVLISTVIVALSSVNADVTWTLTKVFADATTSNLGSINTETVSDTVTKLRTAYIDVAKTSFGIGDKLRLTVALTHSGGGAGNAAEVYIDPAGRTTATETTTGATITKQSSILVPFVVFQ